MIYPQVCRSTLLLALMAGIVPAAEETIAIGHQRLAVVAASGPGGAGGAGVRAIAPEVTIYPQGVPQTAQHAMALTRGINFKPASGTTIQALADRYAIILGESPVPGCAVGTVPGARAWDAVTLAATMSQDPTVAWAEPVVRRLHATRAIPDDPKYGQQKGYLDLMNLESVWTSFKGTGINIAIVDEGIDLTHPDLSFRGTIRLDVVGNDTDPSPGSADENHATMVAGVAGAKGFNNLGVCGVAPSASVIPIRLISGAANTDLQDATAVLFQITGTATDLVMVSNNSWGPDDLHVVTQGPGGIMLDALDTGVTQGRSGKGTVYVWAAGNGDNDGDNMAFDGFASSRYVIAVGSTGHNGVKASYSETGPALFCNAPGGEFFRGEGMITTDRQGSDGVNLTTGTGGDYTLVANGEVGTSFAAPMVAGVVALMLQANSALTARDVRHIIAATAQKTDASDAGWLTNAAGLHWSPKYGFGRIDAQAAVTAAQSATLKPAPATSWKLTSTTAAQNIPDATGGVQYQFKFQRQEVGQVFHAEWVELTVNPTHPKQKDLEYTLTSPSGTKAVFARRPLDSAVAGTWMFTSVATWNELAEGTWTLDIKDLDVGGTGRMNSVVLEIHGYRESGGPANALASTSGVTTTIDLGSSSSGGGATIPPANSDNGSGGGGCGAGGGLAALTLLVGLRTLRRRRA